MVGRKRSPEVQPLVGPGVDETQLSRMEGLPVQRAAFIAPAAMGSGTTLRIAKQMGARKRVTQCLACASKTVSRML